MSRLFFLGSVAFICGCAYFVSWDDANRNSVGHQLSEIAKKWGPPDQMTPLPNGGAEYMYRLKKLDPSCVHWWQTDQKGIITGFRYEGYCRPIG